MPVYKVSVWIIMFEFEAGEVFLTQECTNRTRLIKKTRLTKKSDIMDRH